MADLTSQQAADLLYRTMITGVPTWQIEAAGGMDAITKAAAAGGYDTGAPSRAAINQYGSQVYNNVATGQGGNLAYATGTPSAAALSAIGNLSNIANTDLYKKLGLTAPSGWTLDPTKAVLNQTYGTGISPTMLSSAATTPKYDFSKEITYNHAGAGGQYGYVNGFPVLKASIADQLLAQHNGYVSGNTADKADNSMGWDTGSVQGALTRGAGVFGLKKNEDGSVSGDLAAAAKQLNLNTTGMSETQQYDAINNLSKDLYLVSGKTGYNAGGIGNGGEPAAIPGATTNHATVLYRKEGDALVPMSETAQYFNGEMELSPGGGLSGFIKAVAPIAGIALMATGAGSALGASLLGAGASATAAGAVGGGLIGGGLAAATGGNVLKGAALGALGGGVQGAYTSGALQSTFADITGLPVEQVNNLIGTGAGNTGAYVNQVFDDGSVLVTNSAGQIIGGVDTAGQAFGGVTAQVFDDGSRLLTGTNGQVIGGVDTSGSFFNGTNSISTAGTTGVQTGGANQYAGSGANLGGNPVTNFGGNLATAGQVGALTGAGGAATAGAGAGAGGVGSALGNALGGAAGNIASGLLGTAAGLYGAQADKAALEKYAAELKSAGAKSAPQMQFQPIGMTTRFGSTTTPQYDANGRLIGYGYTPAADIAAQRDKLLTLSGEALPTTTNLTQATTDYYNQLQALQQPGREQQLAGIKANLQATGRAGLGLGATTGVGGSTALAATNPELAAYYNALAQTQAQQALTAQDVAQQRLNQQIATSGNLFTQAGALETAAQQPMTLGTNLGQLTTAGSTNAANAQLQAAQLAAQLQSQGALGVNRAVTSGLTGLAPAAGGLLTQAGQYIGSLF